MAKPLEHARDAWLEADDSALLGQCEVDTYRASGPGGQKRNKTSSAVRLRHLPSGLAVIAEESRSQHENKARALRRLRMTIAISLRRPIEVGWIPPAVFLSHRTSAGRIEVSARHGDFPWVAAVVLDAIQSAQGQMRRAAELLGVTTGQLSRFVMSEVKMAESANGIREAFGRGRLSRGKD